LASAVTTSGLFSSARRVTSAIVQTVRVETSGAGVSAARAAADSSRNGAASSGEMFMCFD